MDYRNCPKCGKMFVQIKAPICPACEKEEEALFVSVKEYIRENPHNNIATISQDTGVSTKKILGYLKEGRLELNSKEGIKLNCESCGKPITKGRYCDACIVKLGQEVDQAFGKGKYAVNEKAEAGARMYTSLKKDK